METQVYGSAEIAEGRHVIVAKARGNVVLAFYMQNERTLIPFNMSGATAAKLIHLLMEAATIGEEAEVLNPLSAEVISKAIIRWASEKISMPKPKIISPYDA